MKICEYCGTINKDNSAKCSSCGGNSFKNKCENCGTEFGDFMYCPNCGVKAGQKAKKCPKCKTEYFSAACPNCGYMPGKNDSQTVVYQTKPRRNIVLWVLGWIFFFPIPLTVLISRSGILPKWAKAVLIAALWVGVVVFFGRTEAFPENADETSQFAEQTGQTEETEKSDTVFSFEF